MKNLSFAVPSDGAAPVCIRPSVSVGLSFHCAKCFETPADVVERSINTS